MNDLRWAGRRVDAIAPGTLPGLARLNNLVRSVRTPEFEGVTFHEVLTKSALNHVPATSRMLPGEWAMNPYRGCTHACAYCFGRPTHEHLGLNLGADFDEQIVVKINLAEVLQRELATKRVLPERVAFGTNTDPYQRAEGRYQLMPPIIDALAGAGIPFSILTKGTVIRRDLDRLAAASRQVNVELGLSIAYLDESSLYLMRGVKELFFAWLHREHPDLVPAYADLYSAGSEAPPAYRDAVRTRAHQALRRSGLPVPDESTSDKFALLGKRAPRPAPPQQTLF